MELVIVTPGTSLRIAGGRLKIREPAREQPRYVNLGDLTQITLDRRCALTGAVLYTCLERGIEVVLTGRGGYPVGRLWSQRFGSITTIRRNQLAWSEHADASAWVTEALTRKIDGQRAVLYTLRERGRATESALERAEGLLAAARDRLPAERQPPRRLMERWRSAEATASRVYFEALSAALPGEWAFDGRSRRPAADAFNAVLNYGYGLLYHHVEGALLHAGLDPTIGVLHADGYRRPSLAYDFIEPYRVWVDLVAAEIALSGALGADDFVPAGGETLAEERVVSGRGSGGSPSTPTDDGEDVAAAAGRAYDPAYAGEDEPEEAGGVWLSRAARGLVVQAVVDYLSEVTEREDRRRTRLTHLQADAHALAQTLLRWPGRP